jgi:hypothetical protein
MTNETLYPVATNSTVAEAIELANRVAAGASVVVTVDSREMYDIAASEVVAVNKALKEIEDRRLRITRPMDEAKREVMDLFRPTLDRLTALKGSISTAMLTWKKEDDRRIEAERQKAEAARRAEIERNERRAAEERKRAEELLAKNANSKAGQAALQRAQDAQHAAELAEVAPLAPVAASASAHGVTTAVRWKVKTINLAELVQAAAANPDLLIYLAANEVQLNALATALKAHAKVPGVVFEPVESARVSRR